MIQDENVAARLQELRRGLERRGVKSEWGKLRVTGLDEKALTVTLETSNYMFYQRFKTAKLVLSLLELLQRKDLTLGHEERVAIEELRHSMEREQRRREEERQAREEAKKREEESRRRREEADKRSRERARKRTEERRRRRERDARLHELVTSIGFPMEQSRKEITDLSREIDQKPSLALGFRLAAQHALYGRPERSLPIMQAAADLHRRGAMEAAALKEAARQSIQVADPDELPPDADAGLRAACCVFAVERGDIGRAYLACSEALRAFYRAAHRTLEWPRGDEARPAADTATRSLFNLRLKSQLLKDSTARGESYLEETRTGSDHIAQAEAYVNLGQTYLCRGLHDEVGQAVKAAETLLNEPSDGESEAELARVRGLTRLLGVWTRLILEEDREAALGQGLETFKSWPQAGEQAAFWDVFVFGTDPHVRSRLLAPFVGSLAERLEAESLPGAARIRELVVALETGSVAGEAAD